MTKAEVFVKSIEKAIKNGWVSVHAQEWIDGAENMVKEANTDPELKGADDLFFRGLLFDHKFAKAFWGEIQASCSFIGRTTTGNKKRYFYADMPLWKYRLQQIVLEEDYIKYLEQFIN
jgi:hypothetical protein